MILTRLRKFKLDDENLLTHLLPAMPFGYKIKKKSFIRLNIVTIYKRYHPSGNVKFNYFGIFQSLKLRILMEKLLSISLKLNFTTNNLGCYGLESTVFFKSKISFYDIRIEIPFKHS